MFATTIFNWKEKFEIYINKTDNLTFNSLELEGFPAIPFLSGLPIGVILSENNKPLSLQNISIKFSTFQIGIIQFTSVGNKNYTFNVIDSLWY